MPSAAIVYKGPLDPSTVSSFIFGSVETWRLGGEEGESYENGLLTLHMEFFCRHSACDIYELGWHERVLCVAISKNWNVVLYLRSSRLRVRSFEYRDAVC